MMARTMSSIAMAATGRPVTQSRAMPAPQMRFASEPAEDLRAALERLVALGEAEAQHLLVARIGVEDRNGHGGDAVFLGDAYGEVRFARGIGRAPGRV